MAGIPARPREDQALSRLSGLQSAPGLNDAKRILALGQMHTEANQAVLDALGSDLYAEDLETPMGRWLGLVRTWTNGVVFRDY